MYTCKRFAHILMHKHYYSLMLLELTDKLLLNCILKLSTKNPLQENTSHDNFIYTF